MTLTKEFFNRPTNITAKVLSDSISKSGTRMTTFVVEYPRMILGEFNTHRNLSKNSSSCLTGDTELYFESPNRLKKGKKAVFKMRLDEFVEKWFTGDSLNRNMQSRLKEMRLRSLNEDTGEYITTNVKDCFKQGIQDVYRITLKDGKTITCTDNHRLYSEKGWIKLAEYGISKIGFSNKCSWDTTIPKLAVNGVEYSKEFFELERDAGKTLRQICMEQVFHEKSTRYFCEKNKIKFRKSVDTPNETFEYKDRDWLIEQKEKGYCNSYIAELCNTTEDRVKKSCRKLGVRGYTGNILSSGNKRVSWNKGKNYKLPEESLVNIREATKLRQKPDSYKDYKEFSTKLVRFMHEVKRGVLEKYNFECAITGMNKDLQIHHIDPIWNNKSKAFDVDNLIPLNKKVHRKLHSLNLDLEFLEYFKSGKDLTNFIDDYDGIKLTCDDIKKPKSEGKTYIKFVGIVDITYLGKQETYDIEVEGTYKNFVANGIVVHNSRAIPIQKMVDYVLQNHVEPVYYGSAKKGMQAGVELQGVALDYAKTFWNTARVEATTLSQSLAEVGASKEVANRLIEPFQMMKVVCSATDFDNFFNLRLHKDSDPNILMLAYKMYQAREESTPTRLEQGGWHLPYIEREVDDEGKIEYFTWNIDTSSTETDGYQYKNPLTLDEAIKYSSACCASVSYRTDDMTLDKANSIFDKLVGANIVHASPFEHIATPIEYDLFGNTATNIPFETDTWQQGITHVTKDGVLCSGNLQGWVQYRHLLPNNTCWKFDFDERMKQFE